MKIAEAFVEVRGDYKNFDNEVVAHGEKAGSTLAKSMASVFSAALLAGGVKKSIDAASGLNEQVNRTTLVFGEASAEIGKFAKGAPEALGMSERAARDATSTIGGLLQNLGLTNSESLKWSETLTTLSADLGSAFDKSPQEAVEALGSALRGESEPIRAFNVMLDEATIKNKAFEMGLYSGKGAIDSNAKAQATLSLIMEQTSKVQGDFANTATSAANAERITAAKAEDAAASFGQVLLPIYERVVIIVGQVADVFGSLPGPLQTATVALVALIALAGPAKSAASMFGTLATSVKKIPVSLQAMSGPLAIAAVAITAFTLRSQQAAKSNAIFAASITELSEVTDAKIMEQFTQALFDGAIAGEGTADALDQMAQSNIEGLKRVVAMTEGLIAEGTATEGQVDNLALIVAAISKEEEARKSASATIQAATAATEDNNDATDDAKQYYDSLAKGTRDAAEASAEFQVEIEDTSDAFDVLSDAASNLSDALDKALGGSLDMEKATNALEAASDDLSKSFEENGKTLDRHTTEGRANRDAIVKQVEAIGDYATALVSSGASNEDAAAAMEYSRGVLIGQLEQFGLTRLAAESYVDELGLTPENIETTVKLANTEATKAEIDTILTKLGEVDDPREPKIQALIDQGKYDEALAMLKILEREINPPVRPVYNGGQRGGGVFASAAGRFVPGGSNMLSTLGEISGARGNEAVLPLGDPSRLGQLLADDRIGGPVSAALGGSPGGASKSVTFTGDIINTVDMDGAFRLANFHLAAIG